MKKIITKGDVIGILIDLKSIRDLSFNDKQLQIIDGLMNEFQQIYNQYIEKADNSSQEKI